MKRLNDTLKQKIADAIREAERNTSCEFVSVITQKSSDYSIYAFLIASLGALLIPHLVHFLDDRLSLAMIFRFQIILFIFLMVLTQLSFVSRHLVPSTVMRSRAALVASESFRKFGLYRTKKRRAVLFFVSLDEKYATILTDAGIDEKIPQDIWQKVIDDFRNRLASNNVGDGYLKAIEACGTILMREFPAEEGDVDELPNELIMDVSNP